MELKFSLTIDDRLVARARQLTRPRSLAIGLGVLAVASSLAYAAAITKPYLFTDGTVISAAQVNANFDSLFGEINAKESRINTLEANAWSRSSTSLYYSGGSVGVGKVPSAATLDVNGTINGSYEGFSYVARAPIAHAAGWAPLPIPTLEYNTFGTSTYNTASGTFTAPKTGYYRFISHGYIITAGTSAERIAIGINRNGALLSFSGGQFSAGDTPGPQFSHVAFLTAGDTIQSVAFTAIAASFASSGTGHHWWFQGEYLGR